MVSHCSTLPELGRRIMSDVKASSQIDWDHPIVKDHGICPAYLLRPLFPYRDSSWEKFCQGNPTCRSIMGVPFFSLKDLAAWLADENKATVG